VQAAVPAAIIRSAGDACRYRSTPPSNRRGGSTSPKTMAKELAAGANIRRQRPQSCQRVADNAFHVHCQSNLQKGAVYGRACDSPEGGKRHAKRNFLVLRVVSWRHPVFLYERLLARGARNRAHAAWCYHEFCADCREGRAQRSHSVHYPDGVAGRNDISIFR
jgi:hypothetical protein